MLAPAVHTRQRGGPSHRMFRELARRKAAEHLRPDEMAKDGLASDGWWRSVSLEHARLARSWVRDRLLVLPHMSDSDCDRFIASLDPPQREELIRRAVNGRGPGGF